MTGRYETELTTDIEMTITIEGVLYPPDPEIGAFSSWWDDEDMTRVVINGHSFSSKDLPREFWAALMSTVNMEEALQESL